MWQFSSALTVKSQEWRYSNPIPNTSRLIRLRSFRQPLDGDADFCLSLPDGQMNLQSFAPSSIPLLIELPVPFVAYWRRVGLRGSSSLQGLWFVNIEFWSGRTMALSNPAAPNYPITTTAASTTVSSSITSVPVLAANAIRKGATIWNASTATLYLDLDATATAADYAVKLDPSGYYEVPFGFTGAISGIWSAVNGSALVREFA